MRKIFATIMSVMAVMSCAAWGQKGHDVTAYVAEQHLTDKAKAAVDSLLEGRSMVYWSNWLDNASHTPEYEYTKTWHYKNIEANEDYGMAKVPDEGNIITALEQQIAVLTDTASTHQQAALALKILIHLVGDLHQPMHMGHLCDRGGNDVKVTYFGRGNNLHSIWDGALVDSAHKWSYTEWQQQIDRPGTYDEELIVAGYVDNWGYDTYRHVEDIYADSVDKNLSYDYVAKWTPVIEDQLLKGGLRLAHLLNTIYQ